MGRVENKQAAFGPQRGERVADGGRDAETDLAAAYCSSAESLHHLKSEHTAAARRAAL